MKNVFLFLLSAVVAFAAEPLSWVGNPPLTTPGGTTGQVLTKVSDDDFDVVWSAPAGGPAAAGTLTGATLAAGVTASSLTSAGGGTFGTAAFTAAGAYDTSGAAAAAQAASQPLDSDLTDISALTTTAFGRSTLTQADAAALRTLAGLGTLATQSGTFSGTSSGTNTGDQTTVSGNAGTATALATPRAINGVDFNGTAPITVTAAAGTLSGATLAAGVTASSLTSFGAAPNIGAATGTGLAATGKVSSSGTAGVGYATGAGGTVTQATNKATAVVLNKICGQITMNAAALAAAAEVAFTVTNSTVAATDVIIVNVQSVGTAAAYFVCVGAVANGSFSVTVGNCSTGSLSQAVVLNFVVLKSVSS